MIIDLSFYINILVIGEYPFCMIKIYFNAPSLIPVNKIAEPVIVLRNTKGLSKKLLILPTGMIHSFHICKCKRVTERGLAHTDITIGIPFFIVSPGEV